MISSTPPDTTNFVLQKINLASVHQLRHWFEGNLITDFRKLEQTRKSTVKSLIVATTIFSVILSTILIGGFRLENSSSSTEIDRIPTQIATTGLCTEEMAKSECDLLNSTAQSANLFSQTKDKSSPSISIDMIELILIASFILGWIFITFIGVIIDNYRLGWRSQIIRQIVNFIDLDQIFSYIGQPNSQGIRESLLHSGMASTNGENLIYIDSDDSLTIKYQNALINISEVNATVSNNSILSIIDKFFQIIYQKLSLRVIFKFNFASLFIKIIRTIVYLIKSILNRRLDYDDFNREVLSQDAGRKIIFKGIFCQIMLPEAGELGQAIIIPAQAKLQPVGFKVPKQMAKAVEVDRAFGKVFKSYASDPITAQTILSPVVRQYSIDYSRTSKSPIYLSVNGRMVYIGIVTPVQLLEPKIGKSMLEFSPVQDYYQAIKFITDIAATLIATSVEDQDRSIEQ